MQNAGNAKQMSSTSLPTSPTARPQQAHCKMPVGGGCGVIRLIGAHWAPLEALGDHVSLPQKNELAHGIYMVVPFFVFPPPLPSLIVVP